VPQGAHQWLALNDQPGEVRDQPLAAVYAHLQHCPSPTSEWQAVREVLNDDERLATLLGIKAISVRRYAKGERTCPDAVAARLHGLALLIQQLEGTYNAYGTRRLFQRPHAALDSHAPQALLQGDWDPDDAPIRYGAQGLLAPTAALHQSHGSSPRVRVIEGEECRDQLPIPAHVILLWCNAEHLPGWCCVLEGRPGSELLPLVRREGMLAP